MGQKEQEARGRLGIELTRKYTKAQLLEKAYARGRVGVMADQVEQQFAAEEAERADQALPATLADVDDEEPYEDDLEGCWCGNSPCGHARPE